MHPERVGNLLFPAVTVSVSGGQVLEFGKESFKRYNLRRAPGDKKKRITYGYLGKPFSLVQDAVESPLPYEHMRDARVMPGIDLGRQRTNNIMNTLTLALEIEQADAARNAANYDTNSKIALTGTDKFSDPASDPIAQMDEYKEAVRSEIGAYPNVAIAGPAAFNATKNNPNVVDRFKYTSPESVTAQMLAQLFDLQRFVCGKAIYFDDSDNNFDVWGNDIVLAYVPAESIPSAAQYAPGNIVSFETPSYAYTYVMDGHPLIEEPYDDKSCDSWIYPGKYERAPVLTGMGAGFLIQNVA
jgi:hypothetical protein